MGRAIPASADTLFQRVIAHHPSTPHAGMARLSRGILALREGREDDATRELAELVRSNEPEVIDTRASLIEALAIHHARADLEARLRQTSASTNGGNGGGQASEPVEPFMVHLRKARVSDDAPYLAHGLVSVAAAKRGWSDVVVDRLTGDLVEHFPTYPSAPVLLSRVAASAAAEGQWPTARRVYENLFARYSGTPVGRAARVEFAEALYRTGATVQARARASWPSLGAMTWPRAHCSCSRGSMKPAAVTAMHSTPTTASSAHIPVSAIRAEPARAR